MRGWSPLFSPAYSIRNQIVLQGEPSPVPVPPCGKGMGGGTTLVVLREGLHDRRGWQPPGPGIWEEKPPDEATLKRLSVS